MREDPTPDRFCHGERQWEPTGGTEFSMAGLHAGKKRQTEKQREKRQRAEAALSAADHWCDVRF